MVDQYNLDLEAISNDVVIAPYWNVRCRGLHLPLLHTKSNYTKESNFWQTKWTPDEPKEVVFVSGVVPQEANIEPNGTRKIRIYPDSPELVDRQIHECRRAYNLCVAKYREWKKGDDPIDRSKLRSKVREQVRKEVAKNGWPFVSTSVDEACREAYKANQAVIRNRTKGQKSELRFRSRRDTKQGIIIHALPAITLPKLLGKVHLTEELPFEALGKMARIMREHGRYFLIVKKHIPIAATEIQGNAVAIDPGVRTFATTYSPDQVTKMGEGFAKNVLRPLGIKLDQLYSKRKRLWNRWKTMSVQLREDLERCYEKQINRLKAKRSDLLEDFHYRVAYFLVTNYEYIFLPTFETKEMSNKKKRKIGTKTVRSMMDLQHFKFKLILKWMARKYGSTVLDVNEAYTSKTQSWSGKIQNVGSAKTISDGTITMDRDINGARGIFLRVATR